MGAELVCNSLPQGLVVGPKAGHWGVAVMVVNEKLPLPLRVANYVDGGFTAVAFLGLARPTSSSAEGIACLIGSGGVSSTRRDVTATALQ